MPLRQNWDWTQWVQDPGEFCLLRLRGAGGTLGTAACSTMPLIGKGAVFSMDTTTTSTSGRPGGHSLAKWKRMRKPSLS